MFIRSFSWLDHCSADSAGTACRKFLIYRLASRFLLLFCLLFWGERAGMKREIVSSIRDWSWYISEKAVIIELGV